MVEGPGCKVKGEKMRGKIKGQQVQKVAGNAVDQYIKGKRKNKNATEGQPSPFHSVISKVIVDVKTLGKELFIFFLNFDSCLRVHFLMSGGFRLNGQKIDHEGGGESNSHELVLFLSNDKLVFNLSAVDIRSASESLKRIEAMHTLDICSSNFSHKRAVMLFNDQAERYVCDVLLDQNVLPGVGNIIKNEALFDSGIKPDTKVSELKEKHISHLVKMTRDFSMIFYMCRRDGKQLAKYYKIYNKPTCKQCDSRVVITRMGKDSARMTSFCPKCQNNDFTRFDKKKLPTKNSLIGWVNSEDSLKSKGNSIESSENSIPEDWSCPMCTLINSGNKGVCEVCLTPKSETTSPETILPTQSTNFTFVNKKDQTPELPSLNDVEDNETMSSIGGNEVDLHQNNEILGATHEQKELILKADGIPVTKQSFVSELFRNPRKSFELFHQDSDTVDRTWHSTCKRKSIETDAPDLSIAKRICAREYSSKEINNSVFTGINDFENVGHMTNSSVEVTNYNSVPLRNSSNSNYTCTTISKDLLYDKENQLSSNIRGNPNNELTCNSNTTENKFSSIISLRDDSNNLLNCNSNAKKKQLSSMIRGDPNTAINCNSVASTKSGVQLHNFGTTGEKCKVTSKLKGNGLTHIMQNSGSRSIANTSTTVASAKVSQNKTAVTNTPNSAKVQNTGPTKSDTANWSLLPEALTCPQHKTKCFMRQVHKKGDNLHRMFWSCPVRGKCNSFQWADMTFPRCEGHDMRTVLRTVLKQGSNNGRKFFACARDKKKQCGFFKWAESPVNP